MPTVTKAADLIAALLPRKAAPLLEKSTGLPHGWGLWLRALPERLGLIGADKAHALVAHFVQSPPAPLPRWRAGSRWQAFRSLFYQNWGPPPREERGLRWLAATVSLLLHLLFALFLLFFAMIGMQPPPTDEASSERTQVEFIGRGTPADAEGGGEPGTAAAAAGASSPTAAQAASAAPTSAPAPRPAPAQAPSASSPASAAQAAEQPLQVSTETPAPAEFVLPEPRVREIDTPVPTPREPALSVPTREVSVVETPSVRAQVQPREIDTPALAQPAPSVREREIPTPVTLPQIRTPSVAAPSLATSAPRPDAAVREREIPAPVQLPQIRTTRVEDPSATEASPRAPANALREREIPSPNPQPGNAGAATAQAPADTAGTAPSPVAGGQGDPARRDAGAGMAAGRAGAPPSPQRGDDWGASDRNAPGQAATGQNNGQGQQPGLFNAGGGLNVGDDLAGQSSTTQPGPPGSRAQQAYDADRASKWTERVQYPYEATMFDKYWVPNESLLSEWVRKGIKSVEIGIPGTNKKVQCTVSLLQLGGACSLSDPNLNNQPATARPPPEIPVKRQPVPTGS